VLNLIDKEECKTREFPAKKDGMDLLDWQNVKETCIIAINQAKINIEINENLLAQAEQIIEELSK